MLQVLQLKFMKIVCRLFELKLMINDCYFELEMNQIIFIIKYENVIAKSTKLEAELFVPERGF